MGIQKIKNQLVEDIIEMQSVIKDPKRYKQYVKMSLDILIVQVKIDAYLQKNKLVEIDSHGGNDIPNGLL